MKLILVVETDPAVTQMLTERLRFAGVEIMSLPTAAEGRKMALDCRPELVLATAGPPQWGGFSLAWDLREQAPEIPVILLSPVAEPWVEETARCLKARALLRLPVTVPVLLPPVCTVLGLPVPPLEPSQEAAVSAPPAPTVVPSPLPPAALPAAGPPPGAPSETRPAATPSAPRPAVSPGAALRFSSPAKILIVEDDRNIAKALAVRLRAAGLEVLMAYDALSGLDMALRQQPDLVILDIGLPAGSGLSVAERIQTLIPRLTPIIFLTASRQPGLRERAMALGPVDYLEKPYDADKLLEAIARALPASS